MNPSDVVICAAARTPWCQRDGDLSGWHPADLAGSVLAEIGERSGVRPDRVVLGCATQIGAQAMNVARSAALAAGWAATIGATTVAGEGASSLEAIGVAAGLVAGGAAAIVATGGVEVMSLVPTGAAVGDGGFGMPFGPLVAARYAADGGLVPPGVAAERLAEAAQLERAALDEFAALSHRRHDEAIARGAAGPELVAVDARGEGVARAPVRADQPVPRPAVAEWLAGLEPIHEPDGRVTAGNSAPFADGAAAVLVMAAGRAVELGVEPLARIEATASTAVDPLAVIDAQATTIGALLGRIGGGPGDVDRFEIDESSAAVALATIERAGIDPARVNPDGGAIAAGRPTGATGAGQLVSLVHRLQGGARGLAVAGGAGGVASGAIISTWPAAT